MYSWKGQKPVRSWKLRTTQCPVHKDKVWEVFGTKGFEIGMGNGFWLCVACQEIRQDKGE